MIIEKDPRKIANEIIVRKVDNRKPDISEIIEQYDFNDNELEAIRKLNLRIDTYMDLCHDAVSDLGTNTYKNAGKYTRKALRVATYLPLLIGSGIGYALTRRVIPTIAAGIASGVASRKLENKFGYLTKKMERHPGMIGWGSIIDVENARKNLERVIENENQ